MAKYNNRKVYMDGYQFDSAKERRRYIELSLLQKSGKISDLQLQVPFELIPAQYETFERFGKNGKRLKDGKKCIEKACVYYADFTYYEDGQLVVEDTKGMRTKDYIIKRKLMLYVHNIRIRET